MIFNISNGPIRRVPILNANLPEDVSVTKVGTSVTFQVAISAHGSPDEYTYQWFYDSTAVSGATGTSYTREADIGSHTVYCTVTNKAGTVKSRTATVKATTLYLYNAGDLCTDVTGGWKGTGVAYDSSIYTTKGVPKVTKNSSNMVIEPNANLDASSGVYHTTNKINLSKYSRLYLDGNLISTSNTKSHVYIGIWSAFGATQSNNRVAYVQGLGDSVRSIDVSGLTGSYYVGIFVFGDSKLANVGGGKATVRKIYAK